MPQELAVRLNAQFHQQSVGIGALTQLNQQLIEDDTAQQQEEESRPLGVLVWQHHI